MRLEVTERDRFLPEVTLGDVIRDIWQKIRRRWHLLAFAVFVTAIASIYYVATATPQYTANGSILIDPRYGQNPDQTSQLMPGLLMSDALTVDSELRVMASREMTKRVIQKLELSHAPAGDPSLVQRLKALLTGGSADSDAANANTAPSNLSEAAAEARRTEVLRKQFVRGLKIRRSGESFVIDIAYTAPDIEFSAQAVNTIIEEYLSLSREEHVNKVERNRGWLSARIGELRQEVRSAESAVANFRQTNNLLVPEGSPLPSEVAMTSAITQLVDLRSEALALDVHIQQLEEGVRSGNPELVQVDPEDRTGTLDQLNESYDALQQQVLEALVNRSESSPVVQNLRNQMSQVQDLIIAEYGQILERLRSQSAALGRQVQATETLIAELEAELGVDAQKSVELRSLELEAAASRDQYEHLLAQYNSASQLVSFDATSARVIAWAVPPDTKSSPKSKQTVILAVFAGIVLAIALIVLLEALDDTFRLHSDISRDLGLSFLGISPVFGSDKKSRFRPSGWKPLSLRGGPWAKLGKSGQWLDFAASNPVSIFAETMRSIHVNMTMGRDQRGNDGRGYVVGITSSVKEEGKTSTSINFATFLASQGKKTVLVDLDIIARGTSRALKATLSTQNGLRTLLEDPATVTPMLEPVADTPNLTVVGNFEDLANVGPQHSYAIAHALLTLSQEFDYVVVDLPPVHGVAETQFLGKICDGLVYVIRWGHTRRPQVLSALKQLEGARGKFIGAIFSQVRVKSYENHNGHDTYTY